MTRTLPLVSPSEEHFWYGGKNGQLFISRCQQCALFIHPTGPVCPHCLSFDVCAEAVSGSAIVSTYTINYQAWYPGLEVPYVIAIVELEEDSGVRLMTNIVNCQPEQVYIGMRVNVLFRQIDDVYLPMFEPEK